MTDFSNAVRAKILELEDEKSEYEDAIAHVDSKIALLEELLEDEPPAPSSSGTKKRKPGRPKGSKNKKTAKRSKTTKSAKKTSTGQSNLDPSILEEASKLEGTDPEIAKRLASRRFVANPRPPSSYGPGVHPGEGRDRVQNETMSDKSISVEDTEDE